MALGLMRITPQVPNGRGGVSLQALRDGMVFLATQPVIVAFMVLDFGATFFGSSRALLPVYARDMLRGKRNKSMCPYSFCDRLPRH